MCIEIEINDPLHFRLQYKFLYSDFLVVEHKTMLYFHSFSIHYDTETLHCNTQVHVVKDNLKR